MDDLNLTTNMVSLARNLGLPGWRLSGSALVTPPAAWPSGAFGLRKHEARCAVVADGDAGSRAIHAHSQTLEHEVCAVAYIHQEQR